MVEYDNTPYNNKYNTSDVLSVNIGAFTVSDWTSFNIERDFFSPVDAWTLVLEDDRIEELFKVLYIGSRLSFSINNNPIMYGYTFDYKISYTRTGGQRLTITGKDLLGFMGQAKCFPNLGFTAVHTNFIFKATDTIEYALQTIFNAFISTSVGLAQQQNASDKKFLSYPNLPKNINIEIEDGKDLTFATGFATGIKRNGKTSRGLSSSFRKAFGHLVSPNAGETYLSYAIRLAKHIGCEIKMSPGSLNTIIVSPPVYDRTNPSPYFLFHAVSSDDDPGNPGNNVLNATISYSVAEQPSVAIAEMAPGANNTFYQSTYKVICINEISGYPRQLHGPLNLSNSILNVRSAVTQLTTGQQNAQGQTGYYLLPANQDLYDIIKTTLPILQMEVSTPLYFQDNNAHTIDELKFGCAKALAEAQDKYFTYNCEVEGFTQNGYVWYPNQMCRIYDEIIDQPISGNFWISKVNFLKNRAGGAVTSLQLSLPYTHNFLVSKD